MDAEEKRTLERRPRLTGNGRGGGDDPDVDIGVAALSTAGAWLMAPEVSLCVVNDQPVGNPKRKV
jgi:hypothetical protein